MAANSRRVVSFYPSVPKSCKLVKWKVHSGSRMTLGTILLIYEYVDADTDNSAIKLKAPTEGTVQSLIANEGDILTPGCELLELQSCLHSVVMKDMCAECGADLRELGVDRLAQVVSQTTFSMIHSVPELRVSHEQARKLGEADEQRLLKSRKLVLLVDLDQTLIHTTNENVPADVEGIFHFQLYGPHSPWYHTKFRPGTQKFLQKISGLFELHIFTFGARPYAHHITSLMDPKGCFFSHRILSRDECLSANSKSGNLKALFPCGDSMVCIIDDREDVWNYAPNVIQVKPYHYFTGTGDINSPVGLEPTEVPTSQYKNPVPKPVTTADEKDKASSPKENKTLADPPVVDEQADSAATPVSTVSKDEASTDKDTKDVKTETTVIENSVSELESTSETISENEVDRTAQNDQVDGKELDNVCNSEKSPETPSEHNSVGKKDSEVVPPAENATEGDGQEDGGDSGAQQNGIPLVQEVVTSEQKDTEKDQGHTQDLKTDDSDSDAKSPLPESASENDDYLMYLEDILTTIHQAFYDMYDQLQVQSEKIPDLKSVIPYVRRKVLKGVNIVFSGVIPTTCNPEKSKLWSLAKAFGANVAVDLAGPDSTNATTHVIAARLGTAKVNRAKKMKGVHIVNPDWLSCCSERWEKVDERLFPLTDESVMRKPIRRPEQRDRTMMDFPPNVTYTGHAMRIIEPPEEQCPVYDPVTGKRIRVSAAQKLLHFPVVHVKNTRRSKKMDAGSKMRPEDSFSNSLSPLLSFSSNEIEAMGREVDDACSEESENEADRSSDSNNGTKGKNNEGTSSEDSLDAGDRPRGWKTKEEMEKDVYQISDSDEDSRVKKEGSSSENSLLSVGKQHGWKKRQRSENVFSENEECCGVLDSEDENCTSKFPRREIPVDSDRSEVSNSEDSNDSIGSVDEEMAAAVEREFLGC